MSGPIYTLYTIGTKTQECYGHGDYGEETRIIGTSGWGGGPFPPVFLTEEEATAYMGQMQGCASRKVVELRLHTPPGVRLYVEVPASLLLKDQATLPPTDTPPTKETK